MKIPIHLCFYKDRQMFRIRPKCPDSSKARLLIILITGLILFIIYNKIQHDAMIEVFNVKATNTEYIKAIKGTQSSLQNTLPKVAPHNQVPMENLTKIQPQDKVQTSFSNNTETIERSKTKQKDYSKDNIQASQIPQYKIVMEKDTGSDFQYSSVEYSLSLIKEGIEHLHNEALKYLGLKGLTTKSPDNSNLNETILKYMQLYKEILPSQKETNQTLSKDKISDKHDEPISTGLHLEENSSKTMQAKTSTLLSDKNTHCHTDTMLIPCQCTRKIKSRLKKCPTVHMNNKDSVKDINATLGESTCNNWATMRGYNQKVISFSLFGTYPNEYYNNTERVIKQISSMYPGWVIRFYHDMNFKKLEQKQWMCALACKHPNVDFCHVQDLSGGLGNLNWTIGTVWRISVMGDPLVKQFMIRDIDSPILNREVSAVNDWIKSGKCFHIMRDNPMHNVPVMAGMWGGCNSFHTEAIPRLRNNVLRWSNKTTSHHSKDQLNIAILLWPFFRKNSTAHDAYSCLDYPGSKPFPTQRVNFTFVGMRTGREKYVTDRIYEPCPMQCRPAQHKDWVYC